jgi:hypothetical protein
MSATQSITVRTEEAPNQAELAPWMILIGTAIGALIIFLIVRRRIIARQHPKKERHIEVDITPESSTDTQQR